MSGTKSWDVPGINDDSTLVDIRYFISMKNTYRPPSVYSTWCQPIDVSLSTQSAYTENDTGDGDVADEDGHDRRAATGAGETHGKNAEAATAACRC